MDVRVSERKMRYLGIGGTYSNTEGVGLEGYWGHRNLFGRAEKLRISGSIEPHQRHHRHFGKLNYNAGIMFEKPGVIGPASKFFANLKACYEHPDAYDIGSRSRAMLASPTSSTRSSRPSRPRFRCRLFRRSTDSYGKNDYLLVSTPLQYAYRQPRRQAQPDTAASARWPMSEPTYDAAQRQRLRQAEAARARPTMRRWRAEPLRSRPAASPWGRSSAPASSHVPADRRFYAGGGGSVRGYAYQGIGPKDANGDPTGGLSYARDLGRDLRIQRTPTRSASCPSSMPARCPPSSSPNFPIP
ncbi:BamA/TamA family outer membrane protein [Aquamicrobium lusatiense]|uniref:BamA/TamA family outer membrane protein n=1 Tax=Aquamicrobium lusatiense TaxID=89772 RepID=UPI002453AB5B|nr:BamA/TamA family outer membrane protein [Aquamicrobium lusatiense]MDH4990621.1 BamA/TamA family outer membrane protein [Aquamicrobium lusatiense]